MKTIALLTAIALSLPAHALDVATAQNNIGGKIILNALPCKDDPKTGIAIATGTNNRVIFGCWMYNNEDYRIFIVWNNGKTTMYSADDFTFTTEFIKYMGANSKAM